MNRYFISVSNESLPLNLFAENESIAATTVKYFHRVKFYKQN